MRQMGPRYGDNGALARSLYMPCEYHSRDGRGLAEEWMGQLTVKTSWMMTRLVPRRRRGALQGRRSNG